LVYDVKLPMGTTAIPAIAAAATHVKTSFVITLPTALPGAATIKVTAEDGTTKTYTINLTVSTTSIVESYANLVQLFAYRNMVTVECMPELISGNITIFDISGKECQTCNKKYPRANYVGNYRNYCG